MVGPPIEPVVVEHCNLRQLFAGKGPATALPSPSRFLSPRQSVQQEFVFGLTKNSGFRPSIDRSNARTDRPSSAITRKIGRPPYAPTELAS